MQGTCEWAQGDYHRTRLTPFQYKFLKISRLATLANVLTERAYGTLGRDRAQNRRASEASEPALDQSGADVRRAEKA